MKVLTTFALIVRTKQISPIAEELSRCERLRGIGWSLSAFSHLAVEQTVSTLRSRVSEAGDCAIPEGYVDAPHALLTSAELKLNIEWAYSNPWKTGVRDTLAGEARPLAPFSPDLDRAAALDLYRTGTDALFLPGRSRDDSRIDRLSRALRLPVWGAPSGDGDLRRPAGSVSTMLIDTAEGTGELPLLVPDLTLPPAAPRSPRAFAGLIRRAARRYNAAGTGNAANGPLVILLEAGAEPAQLQNAAALLQGLNLLLADGSRFELAALSTLPGLFASQPGNARLDGPIALITARNIERLVPAGAVYGAAQARAARGSGERRVRATLEALAKRPGEASSDTGREDAVPADADAATTGSQIRESAEAFPPLRDLVANMMGTAMLPGSGTSATFAEGRPAGIAYGDAVLDFPLPVEMSVKIAGRTLLYRSDSAFSFEGTAGREEVRGLVSHFRVEGPGTVGPGTIILHSSITDGASPLIIDMFRRGPLFDPHLKRVEMHPFVITPFEIPAEAESILVEIEGIYPGGTETGDAAQADAARCVMYPGTQGASGVSPRRVVVRGASFRFTLTAGPDGPSTRLYVGFVDGGLKMIRSCTCWFESGESGRRFRVSVGGSTAATPAAVLSGTEEHVTILLGVDQDSRVGFGQLDIPRALRGHIAPPWLRSSEITTAFRELPEA